MTTPERELTPETRRRRRETRVELGLTFKAVGMLLGVDWSTVRKWETGLTRRCSITVGPRLERLLRGEFDMELTGAHGSDVAARVREVREALAAPYVDELSGLAHGGIEPVLKRAGTVFNVCAGQPRLQRELLRRIEAATDSVLAKVAAARGR
jgi:predicted transcriptional regulator